MNILFLSMVNISTLQQRGIYHDLLNQFINENHSVFIVTPSERRHKKKTVLLQEGKASLLNVQTLNLTKTNVIEKGLGQILVEKQFLKAIKKNYKDVTFDLVLYSTPPITFSKVISYIKHKDNAYSYLLLKDIFPQNAVDMKMIKQNSLIHRYFNKKEKELYALSDTIGCMSEANKTFILKNNPSVSEEKVEVNPNSIHPLFIKYDDEEKAAIKSKYKIPLDKTIFVYGGNLGIPQGVDFLLDTIAKLKEPTAHIVVVGGGTQFTKLEQWFETNSPSNATLLAGLPKNEYDSLLAACDIGMIFLHKDFTIPNFPSRLLAYLEMKKPVLAATDVNTDIGKVIENAQCGYWVEAGDSDGIQNKISALCKSNLKSMGSNSWDLLNREYLVEKSYSLILEKINNDIA
ncbi:glycosyltransferase family 4 protein [Bizionia gelidisalsuginis]|uniref:Glycosyltransferase family 4 protein n=1 Tax=Bizionia gelidisalsuginis TaxID=291188 RepID=A0ABY3M7D8_9FLAO|nr:glycosyltransferase family 4 protein [Bizionia gelidisalsuginis]TYC08811.1 glycosyltransferase family 4 protein [Bizionia gelidisalsuginis]